MFRWEDVDAILYDGTEIKMYRERYVPAETVSIIGENLELDDYAYRHLGSELLMYKIMDTNFVDFMEARGDVSRLRQVQIPTRDF
ncbi:MAG: hypothetical protein ACO1HP_14820 [Bacteroidota bacterium]